MNRLGPERWLPQDRARAADEAGPRDAGRGLLFVLFKWLPQMAVIMAVGMASGLGYLALVRGDLFQASAKLYVRVGVDQTPSPILGSDRNLTFLAQTRGAVQSEMDLLRSDVLVARLIDELDLAAPERRPSPTGALGLAKQRAVEAYRRLKDGLEAGLVALGLKTPLPRRDAIRQVIAQSLILDNATGSDVVSVSLRWADEGQAVLLLDRFLRIYQSFRSTVFQGEGEADFLAAKRDAARGALEAVETEMAAFERTHDIRNAGSRVPLLEADLVEAQRAVDAGALDLGLARRRLERLGPAPENGSEPNSEQRPELAGLGTFAPNSPVLPIVTSLTALLGEREQLRVTSTAQAPEIRQIDAKLAALRALLRGQLEAEVQDLVRTADTAHERLARTGASLRALQDAATRWKSFERRRDLVETRYRDAEKRLSEARDISATRAARLSNVVVVQPAAADGLPIGLRKLPMLGLIAGCSAVLACGWALAREIFDGRLYRGEAAADALGLRLVGEVPDHRGLLPAWFAPGSRADARGRGQGRAEGRTKGRTKARAGDRAARLALDRIVVGLDERLRAEQKTVLAVIGATADEGVSGIALCLADGIGRRRGRRVCLVRLASPANDARLAALGLSPRAPADGPGQPDGPHLRETGEHLIVADCADLGAVAALLRAGSMAGAASRLIGGADLIVVDLPPEADDAEAGPAAARADATLLVAAAGRLSVERHAAALQSLRRQGADVVGLVLNRVRPYAPAWAGG